MKQIYYDNSATTRIDERVLEAMRPYLSDEFGNAGSVHTYGQNALAAVDEARDKIAQFFGCAAPEIIFTSGATESNNLAIQGVVKSFLAPTKKIHLVTSAIEHPSVIEVFKEMKKRPGVEVDIIGVDENGILKIEQLRKKIKANTVLISIMFANNEVGSIQPIEKIKELIATEREKRQGKGLPLYFHVDAVQAVNYQDCFVDHLGVDLLSFSGHKIYGPKGSGVLYVRKGVKLSPICFGGHQEYNLRPGTLNVAGIVGLGRAVELVSLERKKDSQKLKTIKEKMLKEISKINDVKFNGDNDNQLPNIINVSFRNAEGESILMMLDLQGIAISTGSACSSGSLEPSHVLSAMGRRSEWSHGSIRISLGRYNSAVEVGPFVKALGETIEKLRKMAP